MARIGIFGGSFNPIHVGHIALSHQLLRLARLDEILFVVSPLNPFKKQATDLMADDYRLALVEMALQEEPKMRACDVEFHLPKPSYMWRTLEHLSLSRPADELVLIIGADNWLAFNRWAHHEEILSHYELAVYPRPGYPIDTTSLPTNVHVYSTVLFPENSTEIRRRLAAGESIYGLVPLKIEAELTKHKQIFRS